MTFRFKHDRTTKRTFVFAELDKNGENAMENGTHTMGAIYVQKTFFKGEETPKELFITISLKKPEQA